MNNGLKNGNEQIFWTGLKKKELFGAFSMSEQNFYLSLSKRKVQ